MNNEWKTEEFSTIDIAESIGNKSFVVPIYQRGIVWSEQQKADLVDTIKKGLPFGTLLLYKDKQEGTYQLIDGLQRSNAIKEFVDNPAQFFDESDIDTNVVRIIVSMGNMQGNTQMQVMKIQELLELWVKTEHQTLRDVEGMQFSKFGKKLSQAFPIYRGKEIEIGDLIEPMMQNYQEVCKRISDTKIPAIVLEGDSDLLPLLFERINSKGTQLSKYQIYAATWQDKYILSDKFIDLVKANRDRYDLMLEGNVAIDEYNAQEFVNEKKLNTFEIAVGFGKYLCGKWPHLFGTSKDDVQVESIGFTLINSCLGMKNKDTKYMDSKLKERVGTGNINEFLNRILDAIKEVDSAIGKFSEFKSNTRKNAGQRPLHTEFQIVSIITSVFLLKYAEITRGVNDDIEKIKYDFTRSSKEWAVNYKKKFKMYATKKYVMEILQHRWSGTGDKKLDMILINPTYYTREVTRKEFEACLDNWYETLNAERNEYKRISKPKEPELVIMAALYLCSFSAQQQIDGSNYDIEHIIPQNLMKKCLETYHGELLLPISSIGNLCLLPEYANRSKRDKTIYQDQEYLKKSKLDIKELEELYSFTSKEDLEWLDDSLSRDEFKNCYIHFIDMRFGKIKKKLLDNYHQI